MNIQQSIEQATQLHRAGRLQDAERLTAKFWPSIPMSLMAPPTARHPDLPVGRHDDAVDLIRKAIALEPCARPSTTETLAWPSRSWNAWMRRSLPFIALNLGSVDPNISRLTSPTSCQPQKPQTGGRSLPPLCLALLPSSPTPTITWALSGRRRPFRRGHRPIPDRYSPSVEISRSPQQSRQRPAEEKAVQRGDRRISDRHFSAARLF